MIDDNRLTGAIFDKTMSEMAISNTQKMTDHVQLNIRNVLNDDWLYVTHTLK